MLRVLGGVECDGVEPIASRAQRVVLAALVLGRGTVVANDRLADLVWGDVQPRNPAGSLQNHVSRLRKGLPAGIAVVAQRGGYRLEADDDDLDVAAFEAAFHQPAGEEPSERLGAIDDALALWRGPPYQELDDPTATAEAVRLEEIRSALQELRAEWLLEVGRSHEAIAELEARRLEDPHRERTVELLMRAQVAAGHKTEALDVYRQHRESLADDLGLDPSPELRDLETAILTEELVAERPGPRPPSSPEGAARSWVGVPPSTLVGRDDELVAVNQLLERHRVLTLVGPGGVGKTRLSLHTATTAADRFDDVSVVELGVLREGAQLGEVVAGTLDLRPRTDVSTVRRVADAIGTRRHLLVIDNCEHLIAEAAAFVDEIIRHTSTLTILATSREPLNIDGEAVLRVAPLPADTAAVDLFVDRARAADSGATFDDDALARIQRICRSLDGLPLAIELAAARLTTMTLAEIEEGLDERFAVFNRGRRTADDRHRSLRSLVDWSVRSLDSDLHSSFSRCSVFAGTFTADAAAKVGDRPLRNTAEHLADLADRSLLVRHVGPDQRTRYAFLETVRLYARELLALEPEEAAVLGRHAGWVLHVVEATRARLGTSEEHDALVELLADLDDLRVAHRHFIATGDGDRALRMAVALHHLALLRMHAEMFSWITEVAERFGDLDHPDAENVLASASNGAWQAGDLDGARRFAAMAHDAARRSDRPGAGRGASEAAGDVAGFTGEPARAAVLLSHAVVEARVQGDPVRLASTLADLAMLVGYVGDADLARDSIDEARQLLGEGPSMLHAWVDYAEGEALAEADPAAAIAALDRALAEAAHCGARFITGVAGLTRAGLQVRHGDVDEALPGIVDLMHEWRHSGARVQQWITLRTVVEVLVRLGDLRDAAVILGGVLASDSATEAAAADAARLETARARIEDGLPDADARLARGADTDLDALVELAERALRRHMAP